MEKFREIGVEVRTQNEVTAIEPSGREYHVHTQTPQGEGIVTADLVVHAAGRVPDIEELNLSAAGPFGATSIPGPIKRLRLGGTQPRVRDES